MVFAESKSLHRKTRYYSDVYFLTWTLSKAATNFRDVFENYYLLEKLEPFYFSFVNMVEFKLSLPSLLRSEQIRNRSNDI